MYVREPKILAAVAIGQLSVIEAKLIQDGRMQVTQVDLSSDSDSLSRVRGRRIEIRA